MRCSRLCVVFFKKWGNEGKQKARLTNLGVSLRQSVLQRPFFDKLHLRRHSVRSTHKKMGPEHHPRRYVDFRSQTENARERR